MTRTRLPDRRRNTIRDIAFGGQAFTVCVGYDAAGRPLEVFADGQKTGSTMAAFINDACIVISIALQHGMATPDQFWRAFGSPSLEDGSIARFLVFPVGKSRVKAPNKRSRDLTVAAIKTVLEAVRGRARGNLGQSEPLTVSFAPTAERAHVAVQDTMHGCAEYAELHGVRGAGPILRRVAEIAQRIALISAIGRDPAAPVMTVDDFEIGHAIAHWSACEMVRNIASHIADNQTERDVNDVERRVLNAGSEGILKGKLKDQVRAIRKREFDDIVASLEESGRIAVERTSSTTKPGFRITHCSLGGGE